MKTRPVMTGHNHVHGMDIKKPCPYSQPRKTGLLIPSSARAVLAQPCNQSMLLMEK
jgi:hypothetical protein